MTQGPAVEERVGFDLWFQRDGDHYGGEGMAWRQEQEAEITFHLHNRKQDGVGVQRRGLVGGSSKGGKVEIPQ